MSNSQLQHLEMCSGYRLLSSQGRICCSSRVSKGSLCHAQPLTRYDRRNFPIGRLDETLEEKQHGMVLIRMGCLIWVPKDDAFGLYDIFRENVWEYVYEPILRPDWSNPNHNADHQPELYEHLDKNHGPDENDIPDDGEEDLDRPLRLPPHKNPNIDYPEDIDEDGADSNSSF